MITSEVEAAGYCSNFDPTALNTRCRI